MDTEKVTKVLQRLSILSGTGQNRCLVSDVTVSASHIPVRTVKSNLF